MEIKASTKSMRRTTPELYEDFAKSVINEFFYLHQLKQNKILYIGLWQLKTTNANKRNKENSSQRFLGDFELDLSPYYLNEGVH